MDSILNTEVSCFANYGTPVNSKTVNLLTWLRSEKYAFEVQKIRLAETKEMRDSMKSKLPAITPSGLFTYRSVDSLVKHSGFIQFDIDQKGNDTVQNYAALKDQISRIKNVAYCGLSVSGTGFWGLVPVSNPEKHELYHRTIQTAFEKFGISIDPAPKSVVSLRGYSYDPDAYFNHSAVALNFYAEERKFTASSFRHSGSFNTAQVYETAKKLILGAPDGQKWFHLSKASFLLGGYAGGGQIEASEALTFLKAQIEQRADVKSLKNAFKTIERSFAEGKNRPIYPNID